jgi:hypothetical protein
MKTTTNQIHLAARDSLRFPSWPGIFCLHIAVRILAAIPYSKTLFFPMILLTGLGRSGNGSRHMKTRRHPLGQRGKSAGLLSYPSQKLELQLCPTRKPGAWSQTATTPTLHNTPPQTTNLRVCAHPALAGLSPKEKIDGRWSGLRSHRASA